MAHAGFNESFTALLMYKSGLAFLHFSYKEAEPQRSLKKKTKLNQDYKTEMKLGSA